MIKYVGQQSFEIASLWDLRACLYLLDLSDYKVMCLKLKSTPQYGMQTINLTSTTFNEKILLNRCLVKLPPDWRLKSGHTRCFLQPQLANCIQPFSYRLRGMILHWEKVWKPKDAIFHHVLMWIKSTGKVKPDSPAVTSTRNSTPAQVHPVSASTGRIARITKTYNF